MNDTHINAMRLLRLIRTFSKKPTPAYNVGYILCRHLNLPYELADRFRELVKWERYKHIEVL